MKNLSTFLFASIFLIGCSSDDSSADKQDTTNTPPEIVFSLENPEFQVGETIKLSAQFSDEEGDQLQITWQLVDAPTYLSLQNISDDEVQVIVAQPLEQKITITVSVTVSDGESEVIKEIQVTLIPKDVINVSLIYPPADALTDASVTTIRGISSTELSNLEINGKAVTSSDDFLTWTVTLPVEELGTLELVPTTNLLATQVVQYNNFSRTIKQAKPFFVEHESITAHGDMVYLINDTNQQIIQQNLLTDERKIVFKGNADFDFEPEQAIVDDVNNRLVIAGSLDTDVEVYGLTVVALDLTTFETTILFQDTRFEAFESIAFNGDTNKLLIPDWHSDGIIFEIDLNSGTKTVLYAAKSDFGIELDRGYELKYYNGDLLWADIYKNKLYRINQSTNSISVIWQASDYQTELDELSVNLRFFDDMSYNEDENKLVLIFDEGIMTFDLESVTIESYVKLSDVIDSFESEETAYIDGSNVHIWEEDAQQLITYDLDSTKYSATGNESINIGLDRSPRSLALSADETSIYYASDEIPSMYQFPIDANDLSQKKMVFDLSINNNTDNVPNIYFKDHIVVNPSETGFYMNQTYNNEGLYFFEFETLAINEVALIEDIEWQFTIDPNNNFAYTLTELTTYDGEQWIDEIQWKKINLENGEVTSISTNLDYKDTEFEYTNIETFTLTPDGFSLIVSVDDNLMKISTSDGSLSWLSKDKLMPNLSSNNTQRLFWANNELIVLSADSDSGLYKVNQSTGEYSEISGKFAGSGATPFDFDSAVYSSSLQQFFVLDYDLVAIYAIDEVTGERLIIHK